MNDIKRNKIPSISPERLDDSPGDTFVGNTRKEQNVHAFLKGKEPVQPFTIRMPVTLYQELRKTAFDKSEKINQIIISLIKDYIKLK